MLEGPVSEAKISVKDPMTRIYILHYPLIGTFGSLDLGTSLKTITTAGR